MKAPGPDGIQPWVMKNLNESALDRLVILYRASMALGYVPRIWRKANMVFIPKAGKDSYKQAKSYRPISLTSFILKGLESCLLYTSPSPRD